MILLSIRMRTTACPSNNDPHIPRCTWRIFEVLEALFGLGRPRPSPSRRQRAPGNSMLYWYGINRRAEEQALPWNASGLYPIRVLANSKRSWRSLFLLDLHRLDLRVLERLDPPRRPKCCLPVLEQAYNLVLDPSAPLVLRVLQHQRFPLLLERFFARDRQAEHLILQPPAVAMKFSRFTLTHSSAGSGVPIFEVMKRTRRRFDLAVAELRVFAPPRLASAKQVPKRI